MAMSMGQITIWALAELPFCPISGFWQICQNRGILTQSGQFTDLAPKPEIWK
jgi:hypothetical protein